MKFEKLEINLVLPPLEQMNLFSHILNMILIILYTKFPMLSFNDYNLCEEDQCHVHIRNKTCANTYNYKNIIKK